MNQPVLTPQESEALRHVAAGLTNVEMGVKLKISRETVKSNLKRIFRKIGVSNRTQAAVYAMRNGVLE